MILWSMTLRIGPLTSAFQWYLYLFVWGQAFMDIKAFKGNAKEGHECFHIPSIPLVSVLLVSVYLFLVYK